MICYGFYKGYQHHTGTPAGAVNFEKPHHIIALQFSEVNYRTGSCLKITLLHKYVHNTVFTSNVGGNPRNFFDIIQAKYILWCAIIYILI